MPSEAELRAEMEKDRAIHLANPTPPKRDAIRRWQEAQAKGFVYHSQEAPSHQAEGEGSVWDLLTAINADRQESE